MKVLLVDDDTTLSAIFAKALTDAGYTTVTAANGEQGKEKIKSESPDMILLDQSLPDITGNEILRELKENEATKHIPVLLLSNFSQQELVDEAITRGAADYIFKYQVEPADIVEKVKRFSPKSEKTEVVSDK